MHVAAELVVEAAERPEQGLRRPRLSLHVKLTGDQNVSNVKLKKAHEMRG